MKTNHLAVGPQGDMKTEVSDVSPLDKAYEKAAVLTGMNGKELWGRARRIFGAMLHHAAETPGNIIWTATQIMPELPPGKRLQVEVNMPRLKADMLDACEAALTALLWQEDLTVRAKAIGQLQEVLKKAGRKL